MWRVNPKHSKAITFRKITFDDEHFDEYNHPVQFHEDVVKVVELYPYSDAIKREAIGITSEKAYMLISAPFELSAQDQFIIDSEVYRIASISEYEPMQLVIVGTGVEADE